MFKVGTTLQLHRNRQMFPPRASVREQLRARSVVMQSCAEGGAQKRSPPFSAAGLSRLLRAHNMLSAGRGLQFINDFTF